jgi:hypothetical protein
MPANDKTYSKIVVDKNYKNTGTKIQKWKIDSFVSKFNTKKMWHDEKFLHLTDEEGFLTIHPSGNINWWWWCQLFYRREHSTRK